MPPEQQIPQAPEWKRKVEAYRETLAAAKPDVLVMVGSDHFHQIFLDNCPQFLIGKAGVDYFPSYEFVTLSNPSVAWSRNDYRHVSSDVVERIMSNVLTRYVPGHEGASGGEGDLTQGGFVASLKMLMKLEKYADAVALVGANRALADQDAEALMIEAQAARQLDRLEESYAALGKAIEVAPTSYAALERMIMLTRPMRLKDEARRLLDRHQETFPTRDSFRERVTWV